MIVVSLDGAFGGFSAAVVADGHVRADRRVAGNVALEQGLTLLDEALSQAAIRPEHITLLAVGIGPGAFTGLRIAVSYAKSLALGWRLPLAGVNSFDALLYGRQPTADLAVISAKPGTASARLMVAGSPTRFSGSTAAVCDRIANLWTGGELLETGSPEDVRLGLGERGIVVRTSSQLVSPAVAIAQIAALQGHAPSPHAIRADYGETPPAKEPLAP